MKTISKFGIMLAMTGSLFLASCAGGYYVYERPVEPVYERPIAPYPGAIWIEGDWAWQGGRYVYFRGHWDRPRPGHIWVRGAWEHGPRGYRWHRGYWR